MYKKYENQSFEKINTRIIKSVLKISSSFLSESLHIGQDPSIAPAPP